MKCKMIPLSLLTIISSCVSPDSLESKVNIPEILEEKVINIDIVQHHEIYINKFEKIRYFVCQNENAGTEQLRDCVYGSTEEFLIFIPNNKHPNFPKEDLWVEVGINSTIDGSGADTGLIYTLMEHNEKLSCHHNHPYQEYDNSTEKAIPIPQNPLCALHSKADVRSLIKFTLAHSALHPKGSFSGNVVSSLGINKCIITEEGKKHFTEKGKEERTWPYFSGDSGSFELLKSYSVNIVRIEDFLTKYVEAKYLIYEGPKTEQIQQYVKQINSIEGGFIKTSFTPYED